jgi:hypothetical protein
MSGKQIVKYVEDGEWVDGEVVNEGNEGGGFWDNVWSFFFSHGATVGGNEWEEKNKNKNYNDNGREYNPATGNWEYTAEANGNANPYQCNYEPAQDCQGSVPILLE